MAVANLSNNNSYYLCSDLDC